MIATQLRYIVFELVASTPDGRPIYSIADIVEPLPRGRSQSRLLRSARRLAGMRGYVLVGRSGLEWSEFERTARKVTG